MFPGVAGVAGAARGLELFLSFQFSEKMIWTAPVTVGASRGHLAICMAKGGGKGEHKK